MIFNTNVDSLKNELIDEVKLFMDLDNDNFIIDQNIIEDNLIIKNNITINDGNKIIEENFEDKINQNITILERKRQIKRICKQCLYKTLAKYFKKDMPWGSLTGIRPTKIAYNLIKNGTPDYLVKEYLIKDFYLSYNKADLVSKILTMQKSIIHNEKLIEFYVNIPFCPSKCEYCSFISCVTEEGSEVLDEYLDLLIEEIKQAKKIINDKSYVVNTVYIGGGTPTILSAKQLNRLLSELNFNVQEFTVECGRPDTITEEKLIVLKSFGVSRISINPQTFNDDILRKIGRKHTAIDILNTYKLARKYNFDINMDFIAGLKGETLTSFKNNIDIALELSPENITVHTLAIKKGSNLALKEDNKEEKNVKIIEKMVDYSYDKLIKNGYYPYYLYRLKNMSGNLENVGYSKQGKICVFNVNSMEENTSIMACGINAISKKIDFYTNRIDRCANFKYFKEYKERFNEILERKKQLFN